MAQQFLFEYMHDTNENHPSLPDVFAEYFKTRNNMLYLNGHDRYHYKTELQNVDGKWVLWEKEWTNFVTSNVPHNVTTIHFIRQGEDDYYVTVYDINGSKCAGYDRRTIGPKMIRCLATYVRGITLLPGDFLQDIWQNSFTLVYAKMAFPVCHKRVKPWEDRVVRMNGLTGYRWDDFVATAGIEWGQKLVFTYMGNYTLSVVVIGCYDGLGLGKEDIRTTLLKRPPRPILYRDRYDPRMHHICTWYHHNAHVNEDRVVYTPFRADVGYYFKLKIKSEIWDSLNMHKYRKAEIVHMNVSYRVNLQVVLHINNPFKIKALVHNELQSIDGEQHQVPIFHVC